MPVYNAAETLPAALESVMAQTDPAWELVAIDDGSEDASWTVLQTYARRDGRIRPIRTPHRGLVAALNLGVAVSAAPLIARLDADDLCRPERLARQRGHLEARPEVGLVGCHVEFGGDPVRSAGYARHVAWTNTLTTHEAIAGGRFVESPIVHPSVMYRRELLARLGPYRAGDFPEDYELWLRWLEAGVRMEKVPEPLLVWRDGPGRLSRTDRRYAETAFFRVKAGYLARWLARHNRHHPEIVLWGAGRITRQRAGPLAREGIVVRAFVDIDPRKVGRRIDGRPVIAPDGLPRAGTAFVVSYVSSAGAREQIARTLDAAGYRAGVDYVLAA